MARIAITSLIYWLTSSLTVVLFLVFIVATSPAQEGFSQQSSKLLGGLMHLAVVNSMFGHERKQKHEIE